MKLEDTMSKLKDFWKSEQVGKVKAFCTSKKGLLTGLGAVAAVSVAVTVVVLINMNTGKKNVVAADNSAAENEQQTTQTVQQPATEAPTQEDKKLQVIRLEAVADESSITARVLDENSQAVTGYAFTVHLMSGTAADNQAVIDRLSTLQADGQGQTAEDLGTKQFKDEDQNGEVHINNLEAGTYTLMVQAEEGFAAAQPAEATVVQYQVIENIMTQVVQQSPETDREDPQGSRENPNNTTKPPVALPPEDNTTTMPPTTDDSENNSSENNTAPGNTITAIKKDNGKIVYTAVQGQNLSFTASQIAQFEQDSVLIEENGSLSIKTGYVYERGTVEVTEGKVAVIKQFLVPVNPQQQSETSAGAAAKDNIQAMENETTASDVTQQPTENETTAPDNDKETAPTVPAEEKKEYAAYTLSPVIEKQETFHEGWNKKGNKTFYYSNGTVYTGWHLIDGVNYYFNAAGELSSEVVIDVSRYNGDIDWNAVKASGIDYAIIRVGYRGWGTARLVLDSKFDENMQRATAAGVKVGAYIVTQAVNTEEAVEEASFIIEKCRNYNISLPLAIDVEWAGDSDEEGRANALSAAERTSVINAFSETVRNAGYTPMVYANKNWMTNYINAGDLVPFCKVWVAQYADIDCTNYGGRFDMWQFRSDGSVAGISGFVDMSAWVY